MARKCFDPDDDSFAPVLIIICLWIQALLSFWGCQTDGWTCHGRKVGTGETTFPLDFPVRSPRALLKPETMGPKRCKTDGVSGDFLFRFLFCPFPLFAFWNFGGSHHVNSICSIFEFEPLIFHRICIILVLELFMEHGNLQLVFI